MADPDRILEIVSKIWPDYVDLVGEDVILEFAEDAANGTEIHVSDISPPGRGGLHFDLTSALGVIASAVIIVQFSLDNYADARKTVSRHVADLRLRQALRRKAELEGAPDEVTRGLDQIANETTEGDDGDAGEDGDG